MNLRAYTAAELFEWLTIEDDFLLAGCAQQCRIRTVRSERPLPDPHGQCRLPGYCTGWSETDEHLDFAATIGNIKTGNPDNYGTRNDGKSFTFIKENMRPRPEGYANIREINAGLAQVDDEQQDILDPGNNECAASTHPPPSPQKP